MIVTPGSRRFALALIALTAIVAGILYLRANPRLYRKAASGTRAPDVIVVLVDTLRADHLSLYGYERPTSPRLDRLAAERGVVFENVRSQAPCTFPSVNSLLTSRSPLEFVGRAEGEFSIPTRLPTIATILRDAGYSTAAVSASPVVRATPSDENPSGGFGNGFDRFDESCLWEFAPCVNERALELLEEMKPPSFLYLHYMDPHDPYVLPGSRNPRFSGPVPAGPDREHLGKGEANVFAARLYGPDRDAGLDERELEFLVGRYDESIHYWDSWFGSLVDQLERSGRLDDTIVVVASDHGEEFLEHGDLKHCRNVFDTSVRVPLVFLLPAAEPRRLTIPVSNLDVLPTILDLLPVASGTTELEGSSVADWLRGAAGRQRTHRQLSWWGEHQSVSDGLHKLVYTTSSRRFALYRLDRDPGERVDVFEEHRRVASGLARELQQQLTRDPYLEIGDGEVLEKQLKALGYLQ